MEKHTASNYEPTTVTTEQDAALEALTPLQKAALQRDKLVRAALEAGEANPLVRKNELDDELTKDLMDAEELPEWSKPEKHWTGSQHRTDSEFHGNLSGAPLRVGDLTRER